MANCTLHPDEYRPSASLILATRRTFTSKDQFDYNILLIKRTERTSYVLNHCVFPGGVFDPKADESVDWLSYFYSVGVTNLQLKLLSSQQGSGRPELMICGKNFTRDISMRLTALRELFEEVGLLLCRRQNNLKSLKIGHPAQVVVQLFDGEVWQKRVHNDGQQFLELCRHLDVVPDLWALSEWSIWRSPATAKRKYDTIYYFAALEVSHVPLLLEPNEVASAHWLHPDDCWRESQKGVIWLPFILLYETARLMSVYSWQQLLDFAGHRNGHGSTLFQPIFYRSEDCLFGVLPGDELYLDDSHNYTEYIILPSTISEINSHANRYNRYMIYDVHNVEVASNVPPLDRHLPLQQLVNTSLNSKL